MSRLYACLLAAAALAAPLLSHAQSGAPAVPQPSAQNPVLTCMYSGPKKLMLPTHEIACGIGEDEQMVRYTLQQLYAAGWRVTNYSVMAWHQEIRHYLVLEPK